MKIINIAFNLLIVITSFLSGQSKYITLYKEYPKDDSNKTNDYLMHPHDLKILNDLYIVCDLEDNCIKVFSNNGQIKIKIGKNGQGPGDIGAAFKITIDELNSLIYLLDPGNSRISVFNLNGKFIRSFKILNPPKNILYYEGVIYTCGYNDARATLFSIYDKNGKIVNTFESYFDKDIPINQYTRILYEKVSMVGFKEKIYVLFQYLPYICVYSKNGILVEKIILNTNDAIKERYQNNILAIKRGLVNGFIKAFVWCNGAVLWNDKVYYLTNTKNGYNENIIVFNLSGEIIENIYFDDMKEDKSNYVIAGIDKGKFIFYDWSNGKIKIYEAKKGASNNVR